MRINFSVWICLAKRFVWQKGISKKRGCPTLTTIDKQLGEKKRGQIQYFLGSKRLNCHVGQLFGARGDVPKIKRSKCNIYQTQNCFIKFHV